MRIRIIHYCLITIFIIVILGVFNLSVVQGKKLKELSNKNCIRLLLQPGARGRIFDRNGKIMVDNYLTYDVLVMPQERSQVDKALSCIAKVLNKDVVQIRTIYKKSFFANSVPVLIQSRLNIKDAITLEEVKSEMPAIIIQPHPLRLYPHGALASHVIGYLSEIDYWRLSKLDGFGYQSKDEVGFGGVEEKYDYFLRQEQGALSVEVDHRGKFVRTLGFRPAKNGSDLILTIDLALQKIVEDVLTDRKGSIIIMEPESGEILAMASSPSFKPSAFVEKNNSYVSKVFNDPGSPMLNRSISGLYSPGSIFKLVVASAGLECAKIRLNTTYLCAGSMHVGLRAFKCWDVHGEQDLNAAIAHSCDIFFYRTGLLLGPQLIHDHSLKFGLAKRTNIDLPYEVDGFVPSPMWKNMSRFSKWFDGDTANFSIGQGDLLVTPIQMVRGVAVFANGGYLVNPFVVKQIAQDDVSGYHKKRIKVQVKDNVINLVRIGMRKVVSDPKGTANLLSNLGVDVSGKTGTVQVAKGQPHAWFTGFFPAKKPKYAIVVFLENGGSGYASCQLTRQILENMKLEKLI